MYVYTTKKNVYELDWNNDGVKYHEVFHQSEKEFSKYNFEYANTENLFKIFDMHEAEAISLVQKMFLFQLMINV